VRSTISSVAVPGIRTRSTSRDCRSHHRGVRRFFPKGAARHLWLVVLAPVVVGLTIAIATRTWQPWSNTRSDSTEVRLFDPVPRGTLMPRFTKVSYERGTCNASSNVDPAPEVARCFSRRFILDPCWGALGDKLTCVVSPWSNQAVMLTVTRYTFFIGKPPHYKTIDWNPRSALPPPDAPFAEGHDTDNVVESQPPWAMQLENGDRCVMVSGATYTIAGQRANYICDPTGDFAQEADGAWVIGYPDKSRRLWEVAYLRADSSETRRTSVSMAWY
jgi:hypothetical protein